MSEVFAASPLKLAGFAEIPEQPAISSILTESAIEHVDQEHHVEHPCAIDGDPGFKARPLR